MLKNIKLNKNKVKVPYARFKDFVLDLVYLPREELASIREKYKTVSFNPLTRQREESVDVDKFMDEYISKALTGWSGLTYRIVKSLVPSEIEESILDQQIPYSHEDAMWLVKNSSEFDAFFSETMNQVDIFSVVKKEEVAKK